MKVKSRQGTPERGRSAMEDEMIGMAEVAFRMCQRANHRGISASFVIAGHDPLSGENFSCEGYSGDIYAMIGATRVALNRWEG